MAACVHAIITSGYGTDGRPYLVTRVSDEYDLLGFPQARWMCQSLRHHGGRACDVFDLEGGGEIWFDITGAFSRMNALA